MRFIYTKTFSIFAGCLVFLAILVFMQSKGWLQPLKRAVLSAPRPVIIAARAVTSPVKNFIVTLYQLKKIAEENQQLKERIGNLERDLVLQNQQARENDALKKELAFARNSSLNLQPCVVLSHDPFGPQEGLIINCGQQNGISEGQAVVSQGYLAGKITYAGKNNSNVLLSINSNFSVDGKVSQSGQSGIVSGSFNSGIILDQIPQTSDLEKSLLVVTAGINEKIPKNILIGQISEILSSPNDLFKRASVLSPLDFENLEFVFVVKN